MLVVRGGVEVKTHTADLDNLRKRWFEPLPGDEVSYMNELLDGSQVSFGVAEEDVLCLLTRIELLAHDRDRWIARVKYLEEQLEKIREIVK